VHEGRFDESIHAPTRLRLCAALRPVDRADFAALAEVLGLSDATLSKTVGALVGLGYASTSKQSSPDRADARRTTTVALTAAGRRAFDGHIAALTALAAPRSDG